MRAPRFFLPIAVLFLVFFYNATTAAAATFTRSLKIGDRGADVLLLQQLLNRQLPSPIARSGPGSPGQETEYFGQLTAGAVTRFQEQYRSEVLTPVGLTAGTGFFGAMTRAKLNTFLITAAPTPAVAIPPVAPQSPPAKQATPTPWIAGISPTTGSAGTVMVINGSGFDATSNTVYTGYAELTGVPSGDGKTITIAIDPHFPKFKQGPVDFPFWIYIENAGGKSNAIIFNYQAP